jgi:ATP/maltotriose-dependent transcriptional regulator MalT
MRGLHQEGADIFHWSVERLRNSPHGTEEDRQRIVGVCLAAQGHCVVALSRERAHELAHESVSMLRRLPAGKEAVLALKLLEDFAIDDLERLQLAHEALDIARSVESGWWLPKCMMDLGYFAIARGDYREAKNLILEARASYRETGSPALDVQALRMLSDIARRQGDYAGARQLAQECLVVAQDTGYSAAIWWSHFAIADLALVQGDSAGAHLHYQAALVVCQQLDDHSASVSAYCGLGRAACQAGNHDEARRTFGEALQLAKTLGDRSAVFEVFSGIAWLLASTGRAESALQLVAFVLYQPASSQDTKAHAARVRDRTENALSAEKVAAAIEQGQGLDFDITLTRLLAELRPTWQEHSAADKRTVVQAPVEPLTERELEVLRYIAEGLSNYDIATRMFVGVSTVKTHINHLYSKLDVKSRTQAAARARALNLF